MRRIACRRQFSIAGTHTPVLSSADYLLWVAILRSESRYSRLRWSIFFIDRKWWNYQSKMNLYEKTVLSALFHMMQQSSSSLELELDEESLLSLASSAKLLYLENEKVILKRFYSLVSIWILTRQPLRHTWLANWHFVLSIGRSWHAEDPNVPWLLHDVLPVQAKMDKNRYI